VTKLQTPDPKTERMTTILINCSKRKRIAPDAGLCAGTLDRGSLDAVSRGWDERIALSKPLIEAGRLYSGRQFHEALQAKHALNAEMLILSAGLGVLLPCDLVPSYGLTVVPGSSDNVLKMVDGDVSAADWWRALTARPDRFRTLNAAIKQIGHSEDLLLIALPSPYLAMVEHELEQFSRERLSRTRIFTGQSFRFRTARLNHHLMPYDARLDGPNSPAPGTTTDFASRALRDFATAVLPFAPDETPEKHAEVVLSRIDQWAFAVRPRRERQSDADLRDVIRASWGDAGGSASQMLRWLRAELGLACEQGRMRDLYAAVGQEMEAPS
jgi:hypothetical protein